MAVAWMLRNDGKLFDVPFHPYSYADDTVDYEESLANLSFLYNATEEEDIAEKYKNLAREWVLDHGLYTAEDVKSYRFYTKDYYTSMFQKFLVQNIENILETDSQDPDIHQLLIDLTENLNQTFCRVRYGGKVNTKSNSADLYFRLSSTGFNWFPAICNGAFNILSTKKGTETITICRDMETTGSEEPVKDNYGNVYDRMSVYDFLDLPERCIVESITLLPKVNLTSVVQRKAYRLLNEGRSVSYVREHTYMNHSRFTGFYRALRKAEVRKTTV